MTQANEKDCATRVSFQEIPWGTTAASDVAAICLVTQEDTIDAPADSRTVLRRAYRKVDIRLLACYAVLDLFTRIGEHNIVNAAIM
jgi:hypothetical protein